MSDLDSKRNLAKQAKDTINRKRFKTRMLEHVGTAVLADDGKAQWRRAEPGEYFVARVGFWGYEDRKACGNESPYNDAKSKAPVSKKLDNVVQDAIGATPSEIDTAIEHNNRKVRDISLSKTAGKEVG